LAAGPENLDDRRGEITQPGPRDYNRIPPAVGFFGYAQESSAFVLAEFEMKSLPFDLNFFRFENAIHLKTSPESNETVRVIGSKICAVCASASSLAGTPSPDGKTRTDYRGESAEAPKL
jgi:hypothetical protein